MSCHLSVNPPTPPNFIKTNKNIELEADGWPKMDPRVAGFRPPQRRTRPFIKGPIDLGWIQHAAAVNATEVALWLCFKEGFVGAGKWIHIRPRELNKFGLTRKRRNRQIRSLEMANLIKVLRKPGRCPSLRSLRL
jgi:hypothetical protein